MKRFAIALIGAAAAIASSPPARATTVYPDQAECPDGTVMDVTRIGSYTTFGRRIDGKPEGTLDFPVPLEICPDGFILYQPLEEFDEEELARVRAIVATPEYQAILASGPGYLALHHIFEGIDRDPAERLYVLMQATWEVDEDRERYEEMTRLFAQAAAAHTEAIGPEGEIWAIVMARRVNAHRVLGEWDTASDLLATLRAVDTSPDANVADYYDWLARLIVDRDSAIDPPRPE